MSEGFVNISDHNVRALFTRASIYFSRNFHESSYANSSQVDIQISHAESQSNNLHRYENISFVMLYGLEMSEDFVYITYFNFVLTKVKLTNSL